MLLPNKRLWTLWGVSYIYLMWTPQVSRHGDRVNCVESLRNTDANSRAPPRSITVYFYIQIRFLILWEKKKNLFFSGEEGGQFLDSSMVIVCSVFHGDSYSRLVRNKPKIQRNIFSQVKIMFTNIISHSSLWCQVLSFSIINVRIQAGVDPLGRRLKRHRYLKSPFLITQECPEAVRGLAR